MLRVRIRNPNPLSRRRDLAYPLLGDFGWDNRMISSIETVQRDLAAGTQTSRALVEEALERAADPMGEGHLVFTRIYAEQARVAAENIDKSRAAGTDLSSIAGIPISVKDLFDIKGDVTTAGSELRSAAPLAKADATAVARLRDAGAVIVGRTNMTEFAFSGVGLNPHYGTPANPYDRVARRIPGGSSSGAAVSVADGMAVAALGTDTGGSVRIPAALCGLVGFKPTQSRVPTAGVFPLSTTLDSVGTIAPTVRCCHALDVVLSGDAPWELQALPLRGRIFAVPTSYFLDELDRNVADSFERSLSLLSAAGANILQVEIEEIDGIVAANAQGGFAAAESYAFHRRMGHDLEKCEPRVRERILRGKEISAADYIDLHERRSSLIQSFQRNNNRFDFLLCPTVPIVAPKISALEGNREEFRRVNLLLLRNPSIVNFLDLCALTLPCHRTGDPPVGLMVIGRNLEDKRLLSAALSIEQTLMPRLARARPA